MEVVLVLDIRRTPNDMPCNLYPSRNSLISDIQHWFSVKCRCQTYFVAHPIYFSATMPTKYRLYYFEVSALAEISRLLFALADVEYENIDFDGEEWEKTYKASEYSSAYHHCKRSRHPDVYTLAALRINFRYTDVRCE